MGAGENASGTSACPCRSRSTCTRRCRSDHSLRRRACVSAIATTATIAAAAVARVGWRIVLRCTAGACRGVLRVTGHVDHGRIGVDAGVVEPKSKKVSQNRRACACHTCQDNARSAGCGPRSRPGNRAASAPRPGATEHPANRFNRDDAWCSGRYRSRARSVISNGGCCGRNHPAGLLALVRHERLCERIEEGCSFKLLGESTDRPAVHGVTHKRIRVQVNRSAPVHGLAV